MQAVNLTEDVPTLFNLIEVVWWIYMCLRPLQLRVRRVRLIMVRVIRVSTVSTVRLRVRFIRGTRVSRVSKDTTKGGGRPKAHVTHATCVGHALISC